MNTVKIAVEDSLKVEQIVDKHIGKAGLDIEEGRFRVKGTLTLGKVFKRRNVGTNLALSAGYLIEDCETGDTFFVEKQQGVRLCAAFGMRNAFISYRKRDTKDEEGNVMQSQQTIYLQPFPQQTESFTQDDRVHTAFKLDAEGNLIRPFELNVGDDECTVELWRIIQKDYEKGSKLSKRAKRGLHDHHVAKIANIRQVLKSQELMTHNNRKG